MSETIKDAASPDQATSSNQATIRIIKAASCPTCTAKATLTYHIGCNADNAIHFRVYSNTGGGLFSAEWVSLNAIKYALDNATQPITSFTLNKLFKGRSTNTPGFLMAVLKSEGLVRNLEGKIRGYEQMDSTAFMAEINALIALDVDIKVASNKTVTPITKPASIVKSKKAKPASVAPIELPVTSSSISSDALEAPIAA
jgi:hypothetical protein